MVNSDELIGTTVPVTLQARCRINRCRYNRVRLYMPLKSYTVELGYNVMKRAEYFASL
jgi:hypothetical protein